MNNTFWSQILIYLSISSPLLKPLTIANTMVKGPGFYSDIGKKVKELLYKDYPKDEKFTVTTYSANGVAWGTKSNDFFSTDVNTQLKTKNITTDLKLDTESNPLATITVDESVIGLKTILDFGFPYQSSGKVELQYLHKYVGINASAGPMAHPVVNFSGVLGTDVVSLGTDVSFDIGTGNVIKLNGGLSVSFPDLIASFTLNGKGDSLGTSYYHKVSHLTNTTVGAELTHSFSSNENTLTIGMQHELDPLNKVKGKVDNYGKASALTQHELWPKSVITISGEVDTRAVEQTARWD